MINYSDLTDEQQQAFDREFERLVDYTSLELEEADAREAVRYDNFRRELEGTEVKRGDISDEKLEGYLKAGILNRNDGGLEINSVWLPGHVETLEENGMVDLDFKNLYIARDEEKGVEKAVYGDEEGYKSNARHVGALKFKFDTDIKNELKGERKSDRKIEEMLADFVAAAHSDIEDPEAYTENFELEEFLEMNNFNPKPDKPVMTSGGEKNMTEKYEEATELVLAAEENEVGYDDFRDTVEDLPYDEETKAYMLDLGSQLLREQSLQRVERATTLLATYAHHNSLSAERLAEQFDSLRDIYITQKRESARRAIAEGKRMEHSADNLSNVAREVEETNQRISESLEESGVPELEGLMDRLEFERDE